MKYRGNAAIKRIWEAELPTGSYGKTSKAYAYTFIMWLIWTKSLI